MPLVLKEIQYICAQGVRAGEGSAQNDGTHPGMQQIPRRSTSLEREATPYPPSPLSPGINEFFGQDPPSLDDRLKY